MCASRKTIVKISQSPGSAKRRRSEMNLSISGGGLSDARSLSETHLSRRTCDALAARLAFAISFRGGGSECCAELESWSEADGAGVNASAFFLLPEVSAGFTDLIFTRDTRRWSMSMTVKR